MAIPKKIYLQIVDDEGNELDPMKDEVTWCWDKINDNDVEYEIVLTPRALDECPRCKGSCWVMGINEKIRCPACNGTGIRQ